MQSFLGFANYYREFIQGHSDLVHPLQLMIKKGNNFRWTEEAREAFQKMKKILTSSPVLALPIDDGRYLVDTNASEVAVAGVLQQEQPWGKGREYRPITYGSKAMSPEQQKYGTPMQEMLAVVTFLEKWHAYLADKEFTLRPAV